MPQAPSAPAKPVVCLPGQHLPGYPSRQAGRQAPLQQQVRRLSAGRVPLNQKQGRGLQAAQ